MPLRVHSGYYVIVSKKLGVFELSDQRTDPSDGRTCKVQVLVPWIDVAMVVTKDDEYQVSSSNSQISWIHLIIESAELGASVDCSICLEQSNISLTCGSACYSHWGAS